MNDYIKAIRSDTKFREVMQDLAKTKRPIIPKYRVCASVDDAESLIEDIKFKTGQQQGFDMLFQELTGSSPEPNGA